MPDKRRVPGSFDVDTDMLAAALHDLADAIRDGDASVTFVETSSSVEAEDTFNQCVSIDYTPNTAEAFVIVDDFLTLEAEAMANISGFDATEYEVDDDEADPAVEPEEPTPADADADPADTEADSQ